MRRSTPLVLLALLLPLVGVEARGDPEEKASDPSQIVKKLSEDYDKTRQEFYERLRKVEGDEARQKLFDEEFPKPEEYAESFMKVARGNPGHEAALAALSWILGNNVRGEYLDEAHRVLGRDHVADEKMGDLLRSLQYDPSPGAGGLLHAVMEKNPHHEVKGQAHYSYAKHLLGRCSLASRLRDGTEEDVQNYTKYYGADTVKMLQSVDADKLQAKAEKILEQVGKDYADLEHYRGSLAKAVEGDLFELRNLQIGKTAPEIAAEDIFGKEFKLSEYRGKVVVLDFWGDW